MTPSEKEKIIKEGFDAIRKVYNLRDDLLSDAGKLEAARESNRKLSDRVANLEVTVEALNNAIDKKVEEIKRLNNRLNSRDDAMLATIEALEKNRDAIYDRYLECCHKCDANENIMRQMIADNRKKKDEIKSLREELEENSQKTCCVGFEAIRRIEALKKGCEENRKVAEKYKNEIAKLEDNFHELRHRLDDLYFYHVHDTLGIKDIIAFTDWFKDTFGDFGINDEEE